MKTEFFSPYGIRASPGITKKNPYVFHAGRASNRVDYTPAESDSGMFGGNSNWRGPIWMPINLLLIRALLQYYMYYGDTFTVECPTGSGRRMNLFERREGARRGWRAHSCDKTAGVPSTGQPRSFRPIRIGATTCSSTNIFMATMVRAWARATRRDGRDRRHAHPIVRQD